MKRHKPKLRNTQNYHYVRTYWQKTWSIWTIINLFFSVIIFSVVFSAIYFTKTTNIANSVISAAAMVLIWNFFIVAFRFGLSRGFWKPMTDAWHNHVINKKAKERFNGRDLTAGEKDAIVAEERRKYDIEYNKKQVEKEKTKTNNLISYILIGLASLIIILTVIINHIVHSAS